MTPRPPVPTTPSVVSTSVGPQADATVDAPLEGAAGPPPVYRRPWAWAVAGAVLIGGAVAIMLATSGGEITGPKVDEGGVFDR